MAGFNRFEYLELFRCHASALESSEILSISTIITFVMVLSPYLTFLTRHRSSLSQKIPSNFYFITVNAYL